MAAPILNISLRGPESLGASQFPPFCALRGETERAGWMHQPGKVKPTTLPLPSPTPPGCCDSAGPSVGLWVSPRRGSCGCTGRERLLARSLGGRLARLELESRVTSGGGDEGGGWEPLGPITDPRAPPQPSPPSASRLGGGGGSSSAPHPSRGRRLWDYKSRQSLLQGRGPRGDRGHCPRTSPAPSALSAILRVPFLSHGN